jgi:cell division protein FtsI (penicillin-binding protein 3)
VTTTVRNRPIRNRSVRNRSVRNRSVRNRSVPVARMASADDPQYVVTVTFTKPAAGHRFSAPAAPASRTLMSQVLEEHRVAPSTTTAKTSPSAW